MGPSSSSTISIGLDAMYIAKDVEEMLRPSTGTGSSSRYRYLNRSGPTSAEGSPQLGRFEPKVSVQNKPWEKSPISKSEVYRSHNSVRPQGQPTAELGQQNSRDRGIRSLSRTEWEDRRKKGLCFRCGQQYGPAHKCPEGKLRILLLGDDESDTSEGENFNFEHGGQPELVSGTETLTRTCMALEFAGSLAICGGAKTLKFEGALLGIPICILVDSGATHNFVSRRLVAALGLSSSTFDGIRIKLGDGHFVFVTERCCNISVHVGPCIFVVNALVFDTGNLDMVLGMEWLQSLGEVVHDWHNLWMKFVYQGTPIQLHGLSLGLSSPAALQQWLAMDEGLNSSLSGDLSTQSKNAPPSLPMDQQQELSLLLSTFDSIFQSPTSLPPVRAHDHGITLSSTEPICVRPYRYPHVQKTEIERQVQELLSLGMIRPSKSAYSSPVILVRKKDNSWRMCVDYRALNNATVPDKYPIPVVEELIDELHGALYFSKLDLKSRYNQIRMREDSIDKTAFRTHDGHYEYLVMPFGLTNAPTTFQAIMNDIFRPFLRRMVVIFFDDILVYSPSWADHMNDLQSVFTILLQNQFLVNRTKCAFDQESIEYLGHIISGQGVSMDPHKIEAVLNWPVPKHLKGLRGFLGLTGYYRKFVKHYGSIARPLTDLTKKDAFIWQPEGSAGLRRLETSYGFCSGVGTSGFFLSVCD
ncbi:putative nucleotidyltransferase, Ribonuclease H [Helianthus annuus]|nr:putative nucleotidyltransferase, Ribonuclease H [Helianthus annuus]